LPPDRRRKNTHRRAGRGKDSSAGSTVERRQRMKRYLLLLAASIAALAVVLPATAGATTFRGAVVAKDATRKALVTASSDGTVRTVRLHAKFNRFRVGSTVVVRGAKLPDGTYSAAAVRTLGKARGTHVRATVVRQLGARLVMSAGGSVFALRLTEPPRARP
jgi:hypothetical protein